MAQLKKDSLPTGPRSFVAFLKQGSHPSPGGEAGAEAHWGLSGWSRWKDRQDS